LTDFCFEEIKFTNGSPFRTAYSDIAVAAMATFLEKLTEDLLTRYSGELANICVVFPTRRAGLHFKKQLSKKITSPQWTPAVFSIEDFIQSLSNLEVPDRLTLVFELFEIYKKYFPEPFEQFYPWGLILLKDFDDADRSMADTNQLFAYISDVKNIEEQFDLEEEDKKHFEEFWKKFFGSEQGAIRKSFLKNWKHLGVIYSEFKERLVSKKRAYEGLAARIVSERLNNKHVDVQYSTIAFAGFYALSKSEESIINHFVKAGKALLYWDTDSYYADDRQEAGVFIRKNALIKANYLWKENLLSIDEKKIEIIGVPLQSMQAKTSGQILEKIISSNIELENTAVVLPDEQLLFPVLYGLPERVEDINVTMGYPLQASPMFNLIESLFDLQHSLRDSKTLSFYYKHVLSVLTHPYIQMAAGNAAADWLKRFNEKQRLRIQSRELIGNPVFEILFRKIKDVQDLINYFNDVFGLLIHTLKQNKQALHSIEKEYIYHFYTQFKRLEDVVKKQATVLSIETFRSLFREVIYSSRIPFTGEPLQGLQVMGFLETRVLDFENLIILSVNEDTLPPSSHHPSFIPFSIRKIFGLPTFEEQNAIAAYHFYRLLQRAKNIYLVYNTEVKSIQAGEKSRFLLQIENELCKANKNIHLVKKVSSVSISEYLAQPLQVKKSPEVIKALEGFFQRSGSAVKYAKKFSASALTTYISCSLKFYFQYIAKLKELEETDETIEGGLLGTILHEAMQGLYKGHQTITAEDFEKIRLQISAAVDAAIKEHYSDSDRLEGKNILMRNVLIELVERIVEHDKKSAPMLLKSLEQDIHFDFPVLQNKSVILYGIIDRVDITGNALRIIDYKTGKVEDAVSSSVTELFSSPDYKEQFQTFFYSWLYHSNHNSIAIKAGLYRLKKVSEGVRYINEGEAITQEQFAEFEVQLKTLLSDIFNKEIPFSQTDDEKRCLYCAFKDICNR
jgi:hypothetical protein